MLGDDDPVDFQVDVARLPLIDTDFLVTRLGICEMIMGACVWVQLGPARQDGAEPEQEDPHRVPAAAPAQERPHMPPPPAPRTIGQRVDMVEEELRALRGVVDGARADVAVVRRDIGWLVGSITQILVNDGIDHHSPDGTLVRGMRRYSRLPTRGTRRVRPRTDDASTSGTHSADDTDDVPPP